LSDSSSSAGYDESRCAFRASYNRATGLAERRNLMQRWAVADHLDKLKAKNNVVPLRAAS